ncbi:restriction endonuclease subunit S [Lactiplantibacillus plantarum]|nr:restriction endonuclease subunit S [Lactiplantibacillus plantarum]MBO2706036.1 restriction endonuclease subunit S [Lactiplantibacillus plantarum]
MAKIDDSVKKKVPELRFKGFTDEWEERKLSSISERVTRKNKNNESTLPLTISAQDGLVDQNDFFNKQVASRDVTGYFLVKNGEFAYNKSYSNGYPWGAIKRLDKYDMGVLSTLYIVFRPTKINSQFLVSYYDTTRWYREVSKNAAEGARNHGLLNIAPTDFFNTLLVVPKIVDEQQKIGSFFKQLDDTIALHQHKLDLLKEQKKGYLQKMFPKNGAKVPELRFAGFADDWEERKLGDLGSVAMNKRIFKEQTSDVGDIPFYKIGTFGGTPDAFISRDIFEEYKSKYQYPEVGDILISASGSIGRTVVYRGDDEYFQDSNIVWLKHDQQLDNSFLKQFYSIVKWQGLEGSTIKRLYNKNILETKITLPSPEEQAQLGSFFKQLDNTIALHQRKLDLLKEQKKGYLQKMFAK